MGRAKRASRRKSSFRNRGKGHPYMAIHVANGQVAHLNKMARLMRQFIKNIKGDDDEG